MGKHEEPPVCACGCRDRLPVSGRKHRKFIRGHNARVITDGTREKLSKAGKGRVFSVEHRRKLSKAATGRKCGPPSEETLRKRSVALRGHVVSIETRRKISEARKGSVFTDEHRSRLSEAAMGKVMPRETRQKLSRALKGRKVGPYSDERIRAVMHGMQRRPTKPEGELGRLLDALFPGEWKYVGDGSFVVAGKNPDFVRVDGKKQIIEMFGDYWHRGQDPEDRVEVFKPHGFDTLVVWERELEDVSCLSDRVSAFVGV